MIPKLQFRCAIPIQPIANGILATQFSSQPYANTVSNFLPYYRHVIFCLLFPGVKSQIGSERRWCVQAHYAIYAHTIRSDIINICRTRHEWESACTNIIMGRPTIACNVHKFNCGDIIFMPHTRIHLYIRISNEWKEEICAELWIYCLMPLRRIFIYWTVNDPYYARITKSIAFQVLKFT